MSPGGIVGITIGGNPGTMMVLGPGTGTGAGAGAGAGGGAAGWTGASHVRGAGASKDLN